MECLCELGVLSTAGLLTAAEQLCLVAEILRQMPRVLDVRLLQTDLRQMLMLRHLRRCPAAANSPVANAHAEASAEAGMPWLAVSPGAPPLGQTTSVCAQM